MQGQTELPGNLALARWAGWSAGQVGRHVRCCIRSNDLPSLQGKGREEVERGGALSWSRVPEFL